MEKVDNIYIRDIRKVLQSLIKTFEKVEKFDKINQEHTFPGICPPDSNEPDSNEQDTQAAIDRSKARIKAIQSTIKEDTAGVPDQQQASQSADCCKLYYTKVVVPANIDEQRVWNNLYLEEVVERKGGRVWKTRYEVFCGRKSSEPLFFVYGVFIKSNPDQPWPDIETSIMDALKRLHLYRYKAESMPDSDTFLDNYPKYASESLALPTFVAVVLWYEFLLKLSAEPSSYIEATLLKETSCRELPSTVQTQTLKTDILTASILALEYLLDKVEGGQKAEQKPAGTEQNTTPAKRERGNLLWKLYEKTLKVIIDAVLERVWPK